MKKAVVSFIGKERFENNEDVKKMKTLRMKIRGSLLNGEKVYED